MEKPDILPDPSQKLTLYISSLIAGKLLLSPTSSSSSTPGLPPPTDTGKKTEGSNAARFQILLHPATAPETQHALGVGGEGGVSE